MYKVTFVNSIFTEQTALQHLILCYNFFHPGLDLPTYMLNWKPDFTADFSVAQGKAIPGLRCSPAHLCLRLGQHTAFLPNSFQPPDPSRVTGSGKPNPEPSPQVYRGWSWGVSGIELNGVTSSTVGRNFKSFLGHSASQESAQAFLHSDMQTPGFSAQLETND